MTMHKNVNVIVLECTTLPQLEAVANKLEELLKDAPEPTDTASDNDSVWWGLFNLLCDLGVEGYESP